MHNHMAECGTETLMAFALGMGGHFIFDAILIVVAAIGFSKLRDWRKHRGCTHG
jgi:hypothetical protein